MKRKQVFPILLSGVLGITSTLPYTVTHAYAQTVKANATAMYSTNKLTTVTNGKGAIDASTDVAKFKGLKDFTMNVTFTVNDKSGVNSLFFLGNKDATSNYITVYISGDTLGVESRDVNGNQQISNGTVKLTNMDLTKQHKLTFTMSGGHWIRFYVDGKLVKEINVSVNFSQGLFDSANYMGFGNGKRATGMNSYPLNGTLENIELYDSALSEKDIMAYHQGALGNIAYTYQNAYYPTASTPHIHDDKNINTIAQLAQGSISARFRSEDANAGLMSLFSFSDQENNNYISLYVNPNQNKIGLDAPKIAELNGKEIDLTKYHVSIKNTYWHTLTMTKDGSAFKFYLDGTYIDQFTTGVSAGFFNLLPTGDSLGIGYINRKQGNTMPFVGAIDYVKVYPGILDLSSIQMQDAPTMWKQGTQIDMSNAYKTTPYDLFYSGYQGASAYRIPSLLTTSKGTTLAMIDQRNSGAQDSGDINSSVRRKEKGQKQFQDAKTILNLPENSANSGSAAFTIDSSMVQDKQTGRIFAFMDMFPESSGLMDPSQLTNGTGYTNVDGKLYQTLYTKDKKVFGTIREENGLGYVYDMKNQKTGYTVILNSVKDHHERGNLYKDGVYKGNIYMLKTGPQQGELHVLNTSYLWMMYSDDDGKNWSNPVDISGQVKQDWMVFLGTGPGTGIQLQNGNLIIPVYSANKNIGGSQSSAVIISKDHGKTWTLGDSPQTNMGNDRATMNNGSEMFTESQAVQLNNGDIKLFMRNTYDNVYDGKVYMATSKDGGETWSKVEKTDIKDTYCQLSVLHYTKDGKEYIIMTNPDHYPRTQGMVHLGEVQADGSISWDHNQILNTGKFQYSSLTMLSNDGKDPTFGLLYEDDSDASFHLKYTEFDENFIKAPMEPETMKPAKLVNYKGEVSGDTLSVTLKFDQTMMVAGTPQLQLTLGNKKFQADYERGSGTNTIVFKANIPTDVNGIIKADGISLENGMLENIHNLSFTSLHASLYDETKITKGLSIHDYSSQQSASTQEGVDGAAVNVIDQNPNTYWHSKWSDPNTTLPQQVTIDLGSEKDIYKVGYVARQNNVSGRIKDYELAISSDGSTYKTIEHGELLNTEKPQDIEFAPVKARYVRLIANSAYQTGTGSCSMAEMNVYEYSDGVITQGNKEALNNLLDSVSALSQTTYSKVTWDALMSSVKDAQAVAAADISSQNMLDHAYNQVEKSKDALIDITRAQKRIDEITNLKETDYTPTSWDTFTQQLVAISPSKTRSTDTLAQALQNIHALLDKADSNKAVTDVLMQLDVALQTLTKKADKQELASYVKQYEDEALKEQDYDKTSWDTYAQAMQQASNLLADDNATQQQIDDCRNALIQARAGLQVNKEALQQLYNDYLKLDETAYTPTSWKVFAQALTGAKQVLDNPSATPSDLAQAKTTLVNSATSLIRIIDVQNLQRLYDDIHQMDMSPYMSDGVQDLQKALAHAEDVIKNPQSSQQLQEAQQEIQAAYQKLEKKATTEEIQDLKATLEDVQHFDITTLTTAQQKQVNDVIAQVTKALANKEISEKDAQALLSDLHEVSTLFTPSTPGTPSTPSIPNTSEVPKEPSKPVTKPTTTVTVKPGKEPVNTADNTHSWLAMLGLIFSGGVLSVLKMRNKSKEHEEM